MGQNQLPEWNSRQGETSSVGRRTDSSRTRFFNTPLSKRGWPVWAIYMAAMMGVVYIMNPGAGFFELLPDNLPLIGNLDEGAAFMLVWFGLMEWFEGKRRPPTA
jgi:hypothetical protein